MGGGSGIESFRHNSVDYLVPQLALKISY